MAIDKNKLKQIYSTLQNGGYRQDYQTFEKSFTGNDNYANRKKTYDLLTANGAQIGGSYEEFMKKLQVSGSHSSMRTGKSSVAGGHPMSAAEKQQKTATPPSAVPAQSRPRKNQPLTLAQRQAMTGQARQALDQTQAMIADTNERMKDMKRYGVGLGFGQTKEGGATYNPRTEKLERTYITPTGNRYSSKALADAESFHYRQEASKPLGLDMNAQQVAAAQKPADAAVAALWKEAEAKYAADRDKNAEKVYGGNPWLHAGREMHIVDAAINSHKNEMSRLTRFDLQKMMDNAWGRVGKRMTASCYAQLKKQYPTATEQQLRNSASAMARRLSDNAVYKYAVAKNTPKSTLEFFAKTAADTNLLRAISKGLARSEAGTTGDLAAYEQAMSDYGKNHRWAQIGGTVTGMMFDPTTYISGGVGSFASKTALNIGGRVVARKAATNVGARLFGKTLTGRVVAGMAGGAGNLGTYEGIKEGESQWLHGGHINPRTGGNGGYSAGDVLKSSLRGALLGSVTGTMSPLLGNVADKMVKATSSTAGKVGIRAGELVTSTVAEGTVFSIPEWIGGDGDAMDVWTDNMAMMMGFKGQRMIKSAPRVIAGLRPIENPRTARERNHNRMSFVERLRKQVDASPHDMAFSKEEREELRSHGYGDLATLFTRAPKQQPKPKAKPTSADGKAMYLDIPEAKVEDLGKRWLKQHPEFDGYDAMERLMKDPNVSQSARAKAYHVLTGRQLPMGSITGYVREQDGNGNIFVKSVTANGEVVTSRRFADEASAKKEQDKIMRQAELNSVDVGERYTEAKADNKVWEAAIEAVAPGADPETAKRNYQAAKEGDKDAIANYGQMVDAIDKFIEDNKTMADTERPEAIRAAIKGETGVDVDEAIKKEPSKRAEPEKAAVQDYIERLFPEQKAENERPMSDDEAGASAIYDQSRLLWDKVEKGDADAKADVDAIALRMQEAYKECEDAFGTDAEMRMAEMDDNPWALVNDPELTDDQRDAALCYVNAKAAMEGVMDASNEAADGKRKEVEANVERHTHKDTGVVQPATMKVDDKPVYVVKGNVVMLPDGSGIDARNSDRSIVICDAETGEYKFASPDQLLSLGEAIDPQAEFDEAYANIQAEHEAVLGVPENADDVPTYAQNEVLTLLDERGNPVRAEIMAAANEDGLYEVLTDEPIDGKRVSMMSAEEIAAKSPFQEEPSGRMHDDTEDSFQGQEGGATHEAAETNDVKSALSRIPMDEKTKEPRYEEVDADTAWDAIVEQTNGDKALAQEVVDDTVNEMSSGIEKAEKSISKATFKGKGIQERIAFAKDKQERMAALVLEKERLAKWKRIASVERMRAAAVEAEKSKAAAAERKARQEEEEKARQAREETERKEREALNGVPNMTEDKPSDARARGYRRVDGHKVDRQAPVKAVMGKEVQVKFDDKNIPAGHVAIVDASELQPSHIGGQRNAKHFIDEAQPKERKDDASVEAARKIASNIRPEEITTSVTAYTGAPTVNSRGEVIQGNNRSAALKEMWASHPGQGARYKQYLKERASEYGLTAEDIDKVQSPVLVNMLDVSDADAIALGQFVASDTESGGTERLKPKNVTKKLGGRMKTFSNILLRSSDEESSFSELLDRNGVETLKWLNGIGAITPTQYRSSFDSKGNLTAEAKNDLKGVLYQYVFEGGSTQLEEMFNGLPAKAQRAILSTAYRDYESAHDERMIEEIQDSIMAYHALSQDAQFMSATNHKDARAAVESWKRQYAIDDATGESYLPSEKFSNFALLLAVMYKGDTQSYIQAKFNAMYDLIQGVREDTLFGTLDNTPRTLAEAINEILNIDYDGRQRSDVLVGGSQVGQARGTGSPAGAERGERGTQGAEAAERGRRAKESANQRGVEDWNINTAGIFKTSYGKKNKEVYNRHTTVKQPVEAAETSQDAEQGDTQTSSSMNVPTSSESKATNNQSDLQGNGEKSSEKEGATPLSKKIESASEGVDTAPTEAQKEAGNYKKGHVQVGKFDITIEQPRGSIRKGTDANGKAWESKMHNTYGYIRGTVGVDGDHIDVFLSNDIDGWDGRKVYVVDQYNPDGSFDEHKVMLGFNDMDKAKSDYLANYEKGWEKGRRIDVSAMDLEDFEKWIASSKRKTKPFAKYAGLKKEDSQGNPLNADGTLKLERVKSVDDLTDDDFSNPTRSVELPSLPSKVDDAIGAKGKPVIIKKNILEKNYKSHPDLTPNQSREILESALYRPDLYGNNQKTKRPYNWVVINTTDEAGHNRLVLLEVNDNKDNVEIVHWHYIRDNALGTLKKQAEREGGLILILPSEQSEEAGGLSSRTPDLSSDGKDSKVLDTKQENLSEIETQQGADELRNDTAAKQLATNAVLDALGNAGISVEVVSDEVASEMLGRNVAKAESANEEALGTAGRVQFMRMGGKKKSTPETASPDNQDQPTVVSSADGANILKSLDSEIKKYENVSSYPKTFIGDVSKALGATRQGSASEYASFETKSGKTVTIRLSNHNAKVSTFDAHDEAEGISIVVTPKENKGISNDGNAHVTEFYYNAIKLRRAEGKPLVEILKSIKQALYSGAYTDNTGLAEVKEVNVPTASDGQTDSGKVYGWTADGKIFLTKDGINPNTPIHEYTHLWAGAMRLRNEKGWQRVKNLLKGTPIWDEVLNDPNYRAISADEDAVASEALSRISGRENAKKMEAEAQRMIDEADGIAEKAEAVSLLDRMRRALDAFWRWIGKNLFGIKKFESIEEVTDRVLYDLTTGTDLQNDRSLMAVHNISVDKLESALELGGFPMPSIAITNANMGHAGYGDISLVFGKESVDPSDSRNKVYSGDAWTPTFPQIGYKLNDKKTNEIYKCANEVGSLPLFNPVHFHPDNYEGKIDRRGDASLVDRFKEDYGAKQMYLAEKGNAVRAFVQHEVQKYSPEKVSLYKKILETIGLERLKNDSLDSVKSDLTALGINGKSPKYYERIILCAIDYAEHGNSKIENDIDATEQEIDKRIDGKSFSSWLENLFNGVVEKKGIRNERDRFTPSGNSRKWESLYDAVTLDNVIKSMQRQAKKGGEGFFNSSIFGASTKELPSIDAVRREAKLRINSIPDEKMEKAKGRIIERLEKVRIPSVEKGVADAFDFVDNVISAVSASHSPSGIYKYLHAYYPDMTMDAAKEISDIVGEIQKMSAKYFEAKPYRAVGFDEVRAAVVPNDVPREIIDGLRKRGVKVVSYEKGNEQERKDALSSVTHEMDIRFQIKGKDEVDAENGERHREDVEEVNEQYNSELAGLTEENADTKIFNLGRPSSILLSAGVEDKPMKLYGNKVVKKMKKHGFALDELRNLPKAVADPIAVFDNIGRIGNRSILTELRTQKGNFLVTIDLGKGGDDVDFNIVSSVFGKDGGNVVDWIERGLATYINKEKAFRYLHHSALSAEALSSSRLSSAAKIVKDFVNPSTAGEESVLHSYTEQRDELDKRYMAAVKRGDMATAQRMVNEAARRSGYFPGSNYQGTSAFNGSAPYGNGYFITPEERKEAFENDEFDGDTTLADYVTGGIDPMNLDFLLSENNYRHSDAARKEAIDNIREVVRTKGQRVTMYRSVPSSVKEGSFRNGDWVTPSRKYAEENARVHGWGSEYRIIAQDVPISDVWFDGNDIAEWGYGSEADFLNDKDYLYGNTRNNRKLPDAVTYDDNGDVIPLSKRFDTMNGDLRFRTDNGVEEVNERFNRELQLQIDGRLPNGHVYALGMPSDILLSTGVPDLPIQMNASRLKAKATSFGHDFELNEIKDLVKALQTPLAVFAYGDKSKAQNIIVPFQKDGKNFIVGLSLNPTLDGRSLEINSVRNVFPKNNSEWLNWISQGKALYLDKEKVQTLIDQQRTILADVEYLNLNSIAKIVENFENPNVSDGNVLRERHGSNGDEDISLSHDPMGKLLGESAYTDAQRKAFVERERKRMAEHVSELSKKLNLDNVDVVTDASALSGKRGRAKGFFNKKTGRIAIVIPNHTDMADVEKTLLHEAVAHHGLRKLFGENFDNFLDNVYRNAEYDIRKRIAGMASNHGWDVRTATEEYLAGLAEDTNFENMPDGFWSKIKRFFLRMLHSLGFKNLTDVAMGDNELRYVLWCSYENLKEPGRYRNFFAEAADIAKQHQLKVGPYEISDRADRADVAETEVARRKTGFGDTKFSDDKREQQTVNERFNNELTRYQNGEMDKNEMLHLGRPQGVMRTFLPNLPIVMRQRVIKKGSEKKHEVDVSDIMNMPQHLSSPIFVFQRSEDTIGVLTDMRDRNGKNVCVAIELKRQIQQGAEYLEVNDVRSFHGREFKNIVEPIANNKTLKWVDKEKGLAYLSSASQPVQQEIDKQVLNTATKLVKDFVNPKVSDENVADGSDTGDVLYRSGEERTVERVPDIVVSHLYEDAVKDTRDRTMLGALVRTWSKDGRIRFKNKFAESWFDYTRSVKALQDAIAKATGRKVEWFEDVWKSLNAKSSIDEREQEVMSRTLSVPLSRHISSMVSLSGGKYDLDAIEAYLNAKHGLERNELMARRAAEEAAEEAYGAEIAKCRKALAADALDTTAEERLEELTSQYDAMVKEAYAANRRDYAGLTALFDPEKEGKSLEELEDAARKYISEIEGYYDADTVGGLWDKVRALNNFSLKKSYESGLLSKKQYDDVSKMYKWYVPLRGWHDNYAGDVYNYVNRGADRGMIENAVKKAYGRTSRAGNILGTMSAMANSAIVVGNKNKVAQVFMNLALNHEDTGMFTISEAWYEKNEADDSWRIVTPDSRIREGMTSEEVADTIAKWEDEMREKAANGKALMRSGKFAKDFQHNLEAWKEQQHCVRVSRGGKEYLVYVNGNPRATQAINGLLNPDYQPGIAGRILQKYMRHLARVQTSWSPIFAMSNPQRDVLTATGSAYAKNGAGYALQFEKNFAMNTKDIFGLFYKDLHGSLDMNNAKERMFKEFLDNGGKTGISTIYKKQEYEEKYNKSIYRAMHPASSAVMQGAEGIVHGVEFMNSCIENLTRFSTYMTSRQMGKSIKDAIFDAKECSVNFNMKGSGAWGNATLRQLFLYTNPNLQALRMLNSWYEANSVRTIGMLASGVAMGFMVAMVNAMCNGGDGDDNAYYGLSDYYRYTYFNIGIGNRKFLHWRLPQEMASMYALGHISYDRMTGRISTERAIQLSLEQLNNYSPLSFVEGNTSYDQSADNTYAKTFVKAITPSSLNSFTDAFLWDEDFLGRPIGNRKEWNKRKPEWQRVDKRTPEWFIKPFEAIGKVTGCNGYDRKGLTNSPAFNPSAWWYVLMQQGGGFAQVGEQVFNACAVVLGSKDADDMELKDYPFVSTVLVDAGTDNARMRIKNERFWMYRCEYEANKATISSINHARDLSPVEKAEKTSSIQDSRYNLMDFYMKKYYKPLRESIAEAEANGDKAEAKRLKDRLNAVKGMLLKRMDEAEDTSSEASPSPSKGGEKAPL